MKTFVKSTIVLAEQFAPTKEQKKSLVKDPERKDAYAPAVIMGSELRVSNGVYYISKNAGGQVLCLEEGDWIVQEGDVFYKELDAIFKEKYAAQVEVSISETEKPKSKKKAEEGNG